MAILAGMLKSRRIFPPGGFRFTEARTGWQSMPGSTFEETAAAIQIHRLANPRFKAEWSTDIEEIRMELDLYTCKRIKWHPQYCEGEDSKKAMRLLQTPRSVSALAAAAGKVAAGIGVLLDWIGSGGKPVAQETAEVRAAVCAGCPLNQETDLTSFFTVPASNLIRRQIGLKSEMNLKTRHDDSLHVCSACACPMKLKVWTPIGFIQEKLPPNAMQELDPRCWILSELKK